MGVPKFFRYISERYPCLSELVKEYQIPEFDNLYLDMNGIIHVCSHPDDSDPHFRITEEKIFQDIFHYIEVLFRMIKPLKIFYMAVDGVAPRAKMNQQRGRRFKSAKEAEKAEAKARESGEDLPKEARFDSNCITPGTEFMTKLHEQLKYFVVNKISTDPLWQKCKVIFSGHETPGEGEHKIMDYIRYIRSQPGYDPNTRHCLYGLDADLIMLGLCTHEPHFSLLREEVRFAKKSVKRKNVPEYISFYLLHLSLMREYLELEFHSLKDTLPFSFDIEKIIDDWVLMGFLVGNDFIPHLPYMHITNGALPLLYKAYIKVLPTLDGYINEGGTLNLARFQKFMDSLSQIDLDNFSETYADLKYFEGKTIESLNDPDTFLRRITNKTFKLRVCETLDDLGDVSSASSGEDSLPEYDDELLKEEFELHKRSYYMEKLEYDQVTPAILKSQAEGYVRAIQWNLNYYYNGVCSWSWYYPHHYAPYISDIKNFSDVEFSFELGEPFKPFEQLLAVLPPASKNLLPKCYHNLMTEDDSRLKKYYPEEFETDLNGKKQEWEAVVLVPFIDEKLLLKAMEPCNKNLTLDELKRNKHGPMIIYKYTKTDLGEYKAPEYFPTITSNHANQELVYLEDIRVPKEKLIKGAYPGVILDVYYPGFPTLKHLRYSGILEKAKVKVFEHPSRNQSMILVVEEEVDKSLEVAVREYLGKNVFVGWPHLIEATVVSLSNENYRYHMTKDGKYNVESNKGNLLESWYAEVQSTTETYKNRMGIRVGDTNILAHVKIMTGRKYFFSQHDRISFDKQWSDIVSPFPLQTVVKDINAYIEGASHKDINDLFPIGSKCFMLGQPHYGCIGKILESKETLKKGRLKVEINVTEEPDVQSVHALHKSIKIKYMTVYDAAAKLGISKYLFSRITGTILVLPDYMRDAKGTNSSRVNIGLNLKFNKRNEEIPGYTKKINNTWYYSDKVVNVMKNYMEKFPFIFDYLNVNVSKDEYYYNEFFPGGENQNEKIEEISNWIKNQEYMKIERKNCGLCSLQPEIVNYLETVIDEFQKKKVSSKYVIMQVKPHLLYNSSIQSSSLAPDPSTKFELLDRVVNVRPSFTVPVGQVGTIVAINKQPESKPDDILYDIVFDSPFAGGLDLNCSSGRGYRLPRIALINKSYGLRQYEEKTGKLSQAPNQNQRENMQGPPVYKGANQQYFPQYSQPNSAFVSCWQRPPLVNHHHNQQNWNQGDFSTQFMPPRLTSPNHNFFMPSFNNKKEPNDNKFDTDFLKKMLGISSNGNSNEHNKASSNSNSNVQVKPSNSKSNDQTRAKVTNSRRPPTESRKESTTNKTKVKNEQEASTAELMRYYQSKNLGVPQYQYYPYPTDQFICQIITIDGNMLCSEPQPTKRAASENISKKYLELLKSAPKSANIKLPIPPKQWCQEKPQISDTSTSLNKLVKIPPPFVPLQAVRQQKYKQPQQSINKMLSANKETLDLKGNSTNENYPTDRTKNHVVDIKNQQKIDKPKRERKVRIAAKFPNTTLN